MAEAARVVFDGFMQFLLDLEVCKLLIKKTKKKESHFKLKQCDMDKWSKQYVIIPYVFSKWASFPPPKHESETRNMKLGWAIKKSVVLMLMCSRETERLTIKVCGEIRRVDSQ